MRKKSRTSNFDKRISFDDIFAFGGASVLTSY